MPATDVTPPHLSRAGNTGSAPQSAANRLQGANEHDFTSHMPSQVSWTIDNLPDIIYQWKPTAANISTGEAGLKLYPIFGKVLRDFDVLPDRISSNVEPWLLQAWFRLDSRIRWEDITDRIEPSARPKWNTINMDCVRQREDFFMRPWSTSKGVRTQTRDEVFERVLREAGIDPTRNTTRGLTPGLIDPNAEPNSARVPVPERWTRPRQQRKAAVNTVLVVTDARVRPSLRSSSRKFDAKKRKAMEREEVARPHQVDGTRAPTTAKHKLGGTRSLDEQSVQNGQALLADKVESSDERRSHKRKARTLETVEGDEHRTPKRRDIEMAKWQQLPEETPRKRRAPRSGETEQTEQERPRKTRKLQSQAVKELEVEKGTEDLNGSLYPEGRSAKGNEHHNLRIQTLLPACPKSQKQRMATGSRAPTLSREKQATDSFDVGATRAYIGYLQAPVVELEAKDDQIESVVREHFNYVDSIERRHPPAIQSPALGTLDFRAYADTETEHSADLSLPSAVMTPRDLGEDMITSGHSTQSDLFGNCMADEFEDFLQRAFYSTSA